MDNDLELPVLPENRNAIIEGNPLEAEAQILLRRPDRFQLLADRARALMVNFGGDAVETLSTLIDMLGMHIRGRYLISTHDLVLILGCLLYVATPLDFVPDVVPIIGYTDDIAILGYTANRLTARLWHYRSWRSENNVKAVRIQNENRIVQKGGCC